MILWSKYNLLFFSQRLGYFLYNALSNVFIELDEPHYGILKQLEDKPPLLKFDFEKQFLSLLLENNILVKKSDEEKLLMERQYKRDALSFDSTHLVLSICPTLYCNFRCPYCFEDSQTNATIMNTQTVDRLISFIKSFKDAKYLSITWYGGEPTIAFDVICDITRRIKELDVIIKEAGLVTNAYLLREDKISQLNDLNINNIQITIDGPEEVHDTRRTLAGGHPTYQQIMENINILMNSSYEGSCNIRVNLDKNNLSKFFELRTHLLERFKGKNLSVYAGYIDTEQDHKDKNCNLAMHRVIMGKAPEENLITDHINRNKLDNRRLNLRWATHAQNMRNSKGRSGYKGVKQTGNKWTARITYLDTEYNLGRFNTDKEAARVYDKAARHFFGKYAFLNFPKEYYIKKVRHIDYVHVPKERKTKYQGVSYFGHGGKRIKRWRAVCRRKNLGYFHTEYEAHLAYERFKYEDKKD